MRFQVALLAVLVSLAACQGDEPVLSGVPHKEKAARKAWDDAAKDARDPAIETPEPRRAPKPASVAYEKAPGVYVDARWMGGRSFTANRLEIENQMGALVKQEDLGPREGEEQTWEHGVLRVVRDRIYMIRVTLPQPMTRGDALEATGFPPYVDPWRETSWEYRLGHEWGFIRFRLRRESDSSDKVVSVEAWKENPQDLTK